MQKLCVVILLSALLSLFEATPQTKWSRPIRNTQNRSIRERRQFSFGEWVPLSQPCPTCRPFADPLDVGLRSENIGLTPPRPPTVTRQVHGEANFFPDESSILSVPPPPPSAIPRHPGSNFQFSSFGTQFNPLPTQQIFPQTQQIQFLPQSFLPNQQVLLNNQQILSPFGQDQNKVNQGKVINFNNNFKTQQIPQNIVLEQNKQTFANKPQPFTPQKQQQSANPQQHSFAFGSAILTPPPAPNNTQNIVIPGLDKEEIQLLYVPVETLRQRGNFRQQQLINQDAQNIQFQNRPNPQPVNSNPTKQPPNTQEKEQFVNRNVGQTVSNFKVTTPQPFSSSVSPSTALFTGNVHIPFQQTPQPFVSATPITPTIQPFVTSGTQKFSPFTPETTLPQLSTLPNSIQYSPQDIEFGTTPKSIFNQGFKDDGKFSTFNQEQPKPTKQTFSNQHETASPQFFQEPQKQNNFPQQIDQQRIYLQRQQEQQRLLQEQEEKLRQEKELEAQRLLQQRQKEEKRLLELQRQKEEQRLLELQREKEEQRLLELQREKEEQRLLELQRQKEAQRILEQKKLAEQKEQLLLQQQRQKEQQRLLQQQKEREQQRILLEQQRELENQRRLQLQKELEEKRRLQQKQEEEQQRLLRIQQQQREEQERQKLLQKQEQQRLLLQRQKEENLRKQQQLQFLQQQQKKQIPQQTNRHLPTNDNLIPQVEKELELENKQLVPHQPPLSVFYRGASPAASHIVDVLRDLRSSKTIIVLDQYFEQMPKVFVGPAGLIPPNGYKKFDLPYLSNIDTRFERRIDKLPFFVAPVNFVPPPGYAKILFPAPHVGSVVVSSEFNPAMKLEASEEKTEGFSMVGPELPGLINSLETDTTTIKPVASTPSLPQTTAQLRSKRPNNNIYKPQTRKPISKTRYQTTETYQTTEAVKETTEPVRKPFNRFLHRRRQQTTTESSLKNQKSLENRQYSVEVYHQEKNPEQVAKTQQKNDVLQGEYEKTDVIDRATAGGHGVFRVQPTPDYYTVQSTKIPNDNFELQNFEDGPLPTGSAKTITHELYRPNAIQPVSLTPKEDTEKLYENPRLTELPTSGPIELTSKEYSEEQSVYSTAAEEKSSVEVSQTEIPQTQSPNVSGEQNSYFGSGEEYASALAELSKHHQMTRPTELPKTPLLTYSSSHSPSEVSEELEAPVYQQEFNPSSEKTLTEVDDSSKYVSPDIVSPTAPGVSQEQYSTEHSEKDERIGSFISYDNTDSIVQDQIQSSPSPTPTPFQVTVPEKYPEISTPAAHTPEPAPVEEDPETKLPNPSIVRVRTRNRNRSRGQVNFAASQSTTVPPYTRAKAEEQKSVRDYQPIKTQLRGLKKPIRTTAEPEYKSNVYTSRTTTEPEYKAHAYTSRTTAEPEYKANVYTIRPHRRPNPSTVSTKRIRRPTSPIPSVESVTEAVGLSTSEPYYQPEHSDFSPSGVSNDVYYEHSSLSPARQNLIKYTAPAGEKSDVIGVYPSPVPTHAIIQEEAHVPEESVVSENPSHEQQALPEVQEEQKFQEQQKLEEQLKLQEQQKFQEQAEVQEQQKFPEWNPSESGFDVSGIVLTTIRAPSHEEHVEEEEPKKYQDSKKAFDPDLEKKTGRRRVRVRVHKRPHENFETAESQNLRTVANVLVPPTSTYKPNDESNIHQLAKNVDFSFGGQKLFGSRSREYFKKRLNLTQPEGVSKEEEKIQTLSEAKPKEAERSESEEIKRPKFRGYVRKVIKHKEEPKSAEASEEEGKHVRPPIRTNTTGRFNGTRHKTLVRFVKKSKIRTNETETHHETTSQEQQKETTTESHSTEAPIVEEVKKTEKPEYAQRADVAETTTEAPKVREAPEEQRGLHLTQKPKFYQTLRPLLYRPTQSTQRTTEKPVQESIEKKDTLIRPKYGKTINQEDVKRYNEQTNKSKQTQEVRKYLRTKSREGVFSQFGKNKFFSAQKIEKVTSTEETKTRLDDVSIQPTESSEEVKTTDSEETEIPTTTEAVEEETSESVSVEETTTEIPTTMPEIETENPDPQPDIYRFSKSSFSFETEKFTGTKNRGHVRNITTDIIENTASFSAPGVEKRPDIRVVTRRSDETTTTTTTTTTTESQTDVTSNEKTEETTLDAEETTTDLPETAQTQPSNPVTKSKIAKVLKTSTTTKISHETEICYKGKCIRTKSDNPDEDLKKLVDSASIMKIEKTKT